jgi:hypothetical protein
VISSSDCGIGGSQAGLAASYHLMRLGLPFEVLHERLRTRIETAERTEHTRAGWQLGYYYS